MTWRLGVDIGGTFTDVVLADEATGAIDVVKVPTTPRDFAQAVLAALAEATRRHGVAADQVTFLAHATTVVTNALLEARGARTALVTTRGLRDVLELRRSARASLYDMFQDGPSILVPRHLRLEVSERLDAQGRVVEPLRLEDVDEAIDFIERHDVEAVAVCLLYSFLDGAHERAIGARIRAALPDLSVFLSSEVLPEIREFERTSTTAVCAYVGPILTSSLGRLEDAVRQMGLPAPYVMGSSGGVFGVPEALRMPAMVVESGPAAGVIAAALAGRQLGLPSVISFDMGGTTAKASLIEGGEIKTTSEYEVGGGGNVRRWLHGTGHPIRVPVIDLAEVSAGGGSIAWIDPGGALRVGPESAGAEPGPVGYGRGGDRPTVTDADLVLGYLNPVALLGGALPVDLARARQAIQDRIARPLGAGVLEAAAGIVDVVNAGMAAALRIVSVERGYDPREFALVAFGGAGPVHAARLAQELAIPTVIVPPIPGGFSALGLVASDLRRDYVKTFYAPLAAAALGDLGAAYAEMEAAARAMLDGAGLPAAQREIGRAADLRYGRQAYELTVPVGAGPITATTIERLAADFHDKHRMTYGHASAEEPIQLVNLRVSAVGRLRGVDLSRPVRAAATVAPPAAREVYFKETGLARCEVLARETLDATVERPGPLVIESMDSTVVVPPGWRCRADARGFLILGTIND
ncbi:MAG TPA: hydantoinase/oxoprolinase family protein [Candidatus Limnocylindrales bacterium]|nr:hydantoinase/oxoprolinase family protein [Candidatus Limnocylindrales bacterium]